VYVWPAVSFVPVLGSVILASQTRAEAVAIQAAVIKKKDLSILTMKIRLM